MSLRCAFGHSARRNGVRAAFCPSLARLEAPGALTPSYARREAESRGWTPSISFPGKDRWHGASNLEPHPMAPQSVRDNFSEFLSKLQSSTRPGLHNDLPRPEVENAMSHGQIGEPDRHRATRAYGGNGPDAPTPKRDASVPAPDYDEFWEMPRKYWREIEMTEAEMSLIESGGADRDFLR